MKMKFAFALVVEGQTDVAFLSNFIDAEMITTNGSDVPRETIDYLRTLSKIKPIIVLVDPDGPGTKIRHRLDSEIPGLIHAFVAKTDATKKGKVGIAQSTPEAVLDALNHLLKTVSTSKGTLTTIDLLKLGLVGTPNSNNRRQYLASYFHIGYNNGKQLVNRLNQLNINYETIHEALRTYEQNTK